MVDWNKLKSQLYYYYLRYQARAGKISRNLKRRAPQNLFPSEREARRVTVAALQLKARLYSDPLAFAFKMQELVEKAVLAGAHLIVFPENNLTQLIGLLPGIEEKIEEINLADFSSKSRKEAETKLVPELIKFIGPLIEQITLTTFSTLAKLYRVYLLAGSGLLPDQAGGIYNQAYFFNEQGKLMAKVQKAHLLPLEKELGVSTGNELKLVETDFAKIGLAICMDATYFETFRILNNRGAEIILLPIANPEADFNYWTALRGIWGRVQESKVFGIKSALVGEFLGMSFTGQAGVYAPLELTENRDGIIAEAKTWKQEEMIIADIDLEELKKLSPKAQPNKSLWRNYFPQIYYF